MTIDTPQMLFNIRIAYEYEIGESLSPKSRLRRKVELRNALLNAAKPYGTTQQLAEMIGKTNHTTAVHIVKEHDTYYNYSPQYRRNYAVALEVVEKFARRHRLLPKVNHREGGATTVEFELETVNKSIESLQKRRDALIDSLQSRRKFSTFDICSNVEVKS